MIDITKLPREPIAAFRQLLADTYSLLPASNIKMSEVLRLEQSNYDALVIQLKVAAQVSQRIGDVELTELAQRNLIVSVNDSSATLRKRIASVLDALTVFDMDRHFIGEDEIAEFEEAEIPQDEKQEIRDALQLARELASKATFLTDAHKRSINLKIIRAENELYKEKVGIQAFEAAAYSVGRYLKQFGKDAQPLADAVETARTKTVRHVDGYPKLAMDVPPKQIEDKFKD